MRELPSGTVSLVFSDIKVSTLLLNRLADPYSDASDVHRRILRQAWAALDGVELGTQGDSFFVVVRGAPAAVTATAQAQRELDAYPWPAGERLRVRICVHTGNPRVHESGYSGERATAAHLFGAEQGMSERLGMPNPFEREELEEAWAAVGRQMPVDEWQRERQLGRRESLEHLLVRLDGG
jgi:hypothetical protein